MEIRLSYNDLKNTITEHNLNWQYHESIHQYLIWASEGNVTFLTIIWKEGYEPASVDIGDNTNYRENFESNYKNRSNKPAVPRTSDQILRVSTEPREGTSINIYSPNFCDSTSWWQNSTQIVEFQMTNSGDWKTWHTNEEHLNWIDLKHGRLLDEDRICILNPNLIVKVEISIDGTNWDVKEENTWECLDKDYDVDYKLGTVVFNDALSEEHQVRATFNKASPNLQYIFGPTSGKMLKIIYGEMQFTKDVIMTSNVNYEVWGYNPYDLPNKMKYGSIIYKTMRDVLQESTGPYPTIPAMGGDRGFATDMITIPFNYTALRQIKSSQGLEIRIKLDKVYGGEYCTFTAYCLSENE